MPQDGLSDVRYRRGEFGFLGRGTDADEDLRTGGPGADERRGQKCERRAPWPKPRLSRTSIGSSKVGIALHLVRRKRQDGVHPVGGRIDTLDDGARLDERRREILEIHVDDIDRLVPGRDGGKDRLGGTTSGSAATIGLSAATGSAASIDATGESKTTGAAAAMIAGLANRPWSAPRRSDGREMTERAHRLQGAPKQELPGLRRAGSCGPAAWFGSEAPRRDRRTSGRREPCRPWVPSARRRSRASSCHFGLRGRVRGRAARVRPADRWDRHEATRRTRSRAPPALPPGL